MKLRERTTEFESFVRRHIGPNQEEIDAMLAKVGFENLDSLIDAAVPKNIRMDRQLNLPDAKSEIGALAEFLTKIKESQEGEHHLLDRTMVFYTSNLGNSSSHDNTNLPILLAGGGFKHQGHLAFDRKNNMLLSNLFVRMLHQLGIEAQSFGASTGVLSDI